MPWTPFEGWLIRGHRQVRIPPYLDYVAYAKRERGDRVEMFNVEGRTLQEAIERAQQAARQRNRR
jgi:hypothetical protein